jgi:hypothetical protein
MKFFSKLQQLGLTKRVTRFGDAIAAATHQLLGRYFNSFERRSFSKRPHPVIGVMSGGFLLWLSLDFWVLPYVRDLEGALSLRPVQWSQMENLIKLSKTNPTQQNAIETLDDAELQKIRTILQSKRIKPNVLRLSLENPPRIEFQASDVLFSSVVDVLEELRTTWHLYPERVELSSTPAVAVVSVSATLRQSRNPNSPLNLSAIESSVAR